MKFNVKTKDLVAALARVSSVAENPIVTLTAKGKTVRVAAQGKLTAVALRVPATVEKPGSMSIESYMFSQTIKSRAEVTVALVDSQAVITGKSMQSKLVTSPLEEIPVLDKKEGNDISEEVQKAFAACVAYAGITNIHDQNPIGFRVSLSKKGLRVVAADAHHMASSFSTAVKSKTELSFTVDAKTFGTIASLAGKSSYQLAFTESEVLAWSPEFELRIPTVIDETSGPTNEAVTSTIAAVTEAKPKVSCTVDAKEFYAALDTLNGIFEGGANVSMVTTSKGLELKFTTSYGESRALVRTEDVKGAFKHEIDLPLTLDTFKAVEGKRMTLSVYNDRMLYAKETSDAVSNLFLMTLVTG